MKPARKIRPTTPRSKRAPREYQIQNQTPELIAAVYSVAGAFKAAMAAAGLDIPALAKKLGISNSRAWQILDGRTVTLRTIVEVFAACGKKFRITAE